MVHDYPPVYQYLETCQHWSPTRNYPQSYEGLCPLHGEQTPSFHVYKSNHWYCYGCQRGGDLNVLIQLLEGISFQEAMPKTKVFDPAWQPSSRPQSVREARKYVPPTDEQRETLTLLMALWHEDLWRRERRPEMVRQYCQWSRGVAPSTLEERQIGYAVSLYQPFLKERFEKRVRDLLGPTWKERCTQVGVYTPEGLPRLSDRLVFTCLDEEGQAVFYQARVPCPTTSSSSQKNREGERERIKFLNPAGLSKYPFRLPTRGTGRLPGVVVVESPFGPAVLHQHHVEVDATLGNGLDFSLLRTQGTVWLGQDGDTRGDEQATALSKALPVGKEAYRLRPPEREKGVDEWVHHQGIAPLLSEAYNHLLVPSSV